MNNLTHRYTGGMAWASIRNVVACGETECIGPIIDRLAAYEDTGLEPEEVLTGKELAEVACAVNLLKEYQDIGPVDRFRELAQAEKEGRLVVLPCKPGQPIWVESCIRGRVTCIDAPDIVWIIENMERFGTEIFLTREEAEAALKKREETDNEAD